MSDVLCNILLNITYLKYLFFKVIFKLNSKPLFTVHTFYSVFFVLMWRTLVLNLSKHITSYTMYMKTWKKNL